MRKSGLINREYNILTASSNDIHRIISVEEKTWVSAYPNRKYSIRKGDVAARFSPSFKEKRAKEIRTETKNSAHIYKIVNIKNEVVAYSHLLKEKNYNDLVELYVLPEFQGKGIGSALIKDAFSWFGKEKPIRLEVAVYNSAIEIYKHLGFLESPKLKQSKDEDWNVLPSGMRIPVVFMEKLPA